MTSKEKAHELLQKAGVTIGGSNPWDMQVRDERLYDRVFAGGSLALGEAYMDGWWDAPALDQFFFKVLRADLPKQIGFDIPFFYQILKAKLFNLQNPQRAYEVAEKHYDIGNDLYEKMLDARMIYTCGYWNTASGEAKNLDEAQEAKLDLVCRKLNLKPGQKVLDIGCGWGGFLKFAAQKYGVEGVGVTVSKEQAALARESCKGLPIDIRLEDYREVKGAFDAVVSLGMFEHVGYKNYRDYMQTTAASLKDDGLFLLHTIGGNYSVKVTDPWIDKYIFPNGMIPSIKQISEAIEPVFVMEDWHNFGVDYDKTLLAWYQNFEQAWPELKAKYDERFFRMWKYYLLLCAATFRARHTQLWQVVLTKTGLLGGYTTIR